MEVLIFCADKLVMMGNSKNLCVFNFAILLKSRKSDASSLGSLTSGVYKGKLKGYHHAMRA